MPTRKTIRWKENNKKRREILLKQVCEEMFHAPSTSANGSKVPWGSITEIINETKENNPRINQNIINFAYKKYLEKIKKQDALNITSASSVTTSAGGHPKGNTKLLKHLRKEAITAAKNEVTELYKDEKEKKNWTNTC